MKTTFLTLLLATTLVQAQWYPYEPKLMWQNEVDGNATKIDVFTAMGYCEKLQLFGYEDWRLPTQHELIARHKYGFRDRDSYWSSENFSFASGCGTAIFSMRPRYIGCVRHEK